jgi:nonribosomal peptide synthetase DhbF
MDNTFAYVLDDTLQPAPVGLPGELYIAGSGVTRGYLGCAALTAERFIGNPYGAAGTRMYRTGDVVRWRSSGDLEFVGRVDHQVKLRGFRIEQGEVEGALMRDASIAGAVVLLHGGATAQPRLVAYVVAAPGRTVDPVAVRLALGTWLPDYMVPAIIVVVAEFPLTPNGKLNRDALPAPQTPVAANKFTLARTAVEIQVTEIVREVLGIEYAIAIDESFFDLGGHSIAAIQLAARIRSIYNIELPLMDLFESPTIRSMSEFIESLRINSWNIVEPVAGVNLDEGVI